MKLIRFLSIPVIALILFSGCGKEEPQTNERTRNTESEIIRDEGVNISAIDENKDGMVFQCPMDFQVISDQQEPCPLCKMDLEEYSLADAEKNLESHFKE